LKNFFENHCGSDAARFFYKPSRRGSGAVALFYKPSRRGSGAVAFFSNVAARQRQLFSRDGHLWPGIGFMDPGYRKLQSTKNRSLHIHY
jgi:hypothetical protein